MLTTKEFAILISDQGVDELLNDMASLRHEECAFGLHALIARSRNFRTITVAKLKTANWKKQLKSCWKRADFQMLGGLLVEIHRQLRETDVTALYELLGVEYDGISLKHEDEPELLTNQLDTVWDRYCENVGHDRALIVLATISIDGVDNWKPATSEKLQSIYTHSIAEDPLNQKLAGNDGMESWDSPDIEEKESQSSDKAEDTTTVEAAKTTPDSPDFSTLDKLMIQTIVSFVNGTEGSLDEAEVLDLVNELQSLNDGRTRSWFHSGYLFALQNSSGIEPRAPGENDARRAWWLNGFMLGILRQSNPKETFLRMKELEKSDFKLLSEEPKRGAKPLNGVAMLSNELFYTALELGEVGQAMRWLKLYGPSIPNKFLPAVLSWVTSQPEASQEINEVCIQLLTECLSIVEKTPVENRPPSQFLQSILTPQLALLLEEGKFGEADRQVQKAKDLGLVLSGENLALAALRHLGIEGPENLQLPKKQQALSTYLDRIEERKEEFFEAVKLGSPTGALAIAQLSLKEKEPDENILSAMIDLIQSHGSHLSSDPRRIKMSQQFRLIQSVLELRKGQHGSGNAACERLLRLLAEKVQVPTELMRDSLELATLLDLPGTVELAQYHLDLSSPAEISKIPIEDLGKRSPELLALFCEIVKRSNLGTSETWDVWKSILNAAIGSSSNETAVAEEAIDALEELALRSSGSLDSHLLEILNQDLSAIWDEEDIVSAKVRIHDFAGNHADECAQLHILAELKIRNGDDDAHGVIFRLKELQYSDTEIAAFQNRLTSSSDLKPDCSGLVGSILCVGGTEVQKRYEDEIRSEIHALHPQLKLQFEYPGWTSNWHVPLARIEKKLSQVDGVVILKLVRTQFGRNLRKAIGEHGIIWQACTGHGRDYIQRMILRLASRIPVNNS